MAYAAYLRDLLTPLGVYTFAEGSISGGEVESIGAGLDAAAAALEHSEREALLQTAQEEGLSLREALFAKRPAAPTPELRRAAIAALSQIGGDGFTVAAINRALRGCGITACVAETAEQGRVRVTFPDTAGVPAGFGQIAGIIEDIIPCHLETEFYFRYLTWVELEARFPDWASLEAEHYSWEQLEQAV